MPERIDSVVHRHLLRAPVKQKRFSKFSEFSLLGAADHPATSRVAPSTAHRRLRVGKDKHSFPFMEQLSRVIAIVLSPSKQTGIPL
jgi:hypothetical protein